MNDTENRLSAVRIGVLLRFYPLLCQFLMKFILVFHLLCACVRPSPEDDDFKDFQKGGGGAAGVGGGICGLMILFNLRGPMN